MLVNLPNKSLLRDWIDGGLESVDTSLDEGVVGGFLLLCLVDASLLSSRSNIS